MAKTQIPIRWQRLEGFRLIMPHIRETTEYTKKFSLLTSIEELYFKTDRLGTIREEINTLGKLSFAAFALMKYLKRSVGYIDNEAGDNTYENKSNTNANKLLRRYRDALKLIESKTRTLPGKTMPVGIINKIATDALKEDLQERDALLFAQDPNTSPKILEKLSKDNDFTIRRAVALNPSTPMFVVEKMVNDDNEYVRAIISLRRDIPISILEKLVNDESAEVRYWVAHSKNATMDILTKLIHDEDMTTREWAKLRIKQNVKWHSIANDNKEEGK